MATTRSLSAPARPVPPLERTPLALDELLGLALEPGTRDVARRMLDHGASPEFARTVLAPVLSGGVGGAYAIDAAIEVLARSLRVLPSPKRPRRGAARPLLAFVGPTGAGKSTAMARIGRRMSAAGRRVVYASSDPSSLTAFERLNGLDADVDRGEVPIGMVRGPDDLRRLVKRHGAVDAVLLDTPGLSPRDTEHLDELARVTARQVEGFEGATLLVLPATSNRGALQLAIEAFRRFRPAGSVVTKLDETDEPGATVEILARAELPVAFLCDGQDVRAHLVRPTPEILAELVLRGRLPGGSA
jgi:flagellar biosynthesis GTPase FlhF